MSRALTLAALIAVLAAAPPAAAARFVGTVSPVTAAQLGNSYRAGCPVGPVQLRLLRLSYVGFDGKAHVGTMVVNIAVVQDVMSVFKQLYAERFPIRRMEP